MSLLFSGMSTKQVAQPGNKEKKGGPYTKQEQEKRRAKVYELYFEKGHSAVQLAQMLDVNRHTINSDIKFWYTQMTSQIGGENVGAIVLKQIERLEIQRKRLLDQIHKQKDFSSKLALEKLLYEIDSKIAVFVSKMTAKDLRVDAYAITEEITEEEISEIVRYLIFDADHFFPEHISKEEILKDTIRLRKSDMQYTTNVFNTMRKLGLELYSDHEILKETYDLFRFALTRGYITKEELLSFIKKRRNVIDEDDKKDDEIEKKYMEKYGNDTSKWPEGVETMMYDEMEPGTSIEERYGL